ncbi:ketosteroid isomerase-like protein [Alkalispirillum mobile]|uniref:Ketosteroid isomerase-like protein n=1 Tax=Alkalispirillum mobile TaxID=85925 RepID=A0A498BZS5_9GAMM|nr:nuclear transport factor 2 family protein [Alkalispirillum mobile]RLK48269.1 ketosteroid isomerase-like protein [Alkalispirillum mobile]
MSPISREEYEANAIVRYFGACDRKDLDGTLRCLHPEVELILHNDGQILQGRDTQVRALFEEIFNNFLEVEHNNFRSTVDPVGRSIASLYQVRLVDREGRETRSNACNFWFLDSHSELFRRIEVFRSHPMGLNA